MNISCIYKETKDHDEKVRIAYFAKFKRFRLKLECGPMPNVMAALPNIDGALCSMPQSLAIFHY